MMRYWRDLINTLMRVYKDSERERVRVGARSFSGAGNVGLTSTSYPFLLRKNSNPGGS